jgi:Fe-S cluster assembly protein SufD
MSAVPQTVASTSFSAEHLAKHLSTRGNLPAWWLEAKKAAWNQFLAMPMPTRQNETWRFSNISTLNIDGFRIAEGAAKVPALPEFSRAAEMVFANGTLQSAPTLSPDLVGKGVIFCALEEALIKHGELVRRFFQKYPTRLGSEKFTALNTALTTSGAFLYLPKGVEIAEPFAVQHYFTGDNTALFPHTLIALEENAKATFAEFFLSSADAGRQLVSGVNDLHAAAGAELTYIGAQRWSKETLSFQTNSIATERDARVLSLNLHLGGRQSRHESHSRLQGPGSHSEMLALTVANGAQEFDQRTLQTHQAPHTSSNLLYKNALLDTAKTIFSGLIIVEQDAQKTDAYQSNRNLMLSDEAEANSLPGLEIQANDVRCTHGATSGRIDAEQEFYLKARGIDPETAKELLIFGFFEEVLAKLPNESLRAALRTLIQTKFD